MSDLVARLRDADTTRRIGESYADTHERRQRDRNEAADTIATLRAEVETVGVMHREACELAKHRMQENATLRATNERLLAALAARPIKPRHHPEKLRKLTGEDGYHKGWQEALTALGNARAALAEEKPNDR